MKKVKIIGMMFVIFCVALFSGCSENASINKEDSSVVEVEDESIVSMESSDDNIEVPPNREDSTDDMELPPNREDSTDDMELPPNREDSTDDMRVPPEDAPENTPEDADYERVGPPQQGDRTNVPLEAVEVCEDKEEGDSCSFSTPQGEIEGICSTNDNTFACGP